MKIKLNLANRTVISSLFRVYSGLNGIDTEGVLRMADISEAFDLEEAGKTVDALSREVQKKYYDALRKREKLTEAIGRKAPTKSQEEKLFALSDEIRGTQGGATYSDLMKTEPVEFEIEKSDLEWLYGKAKNHKWNIRLQRDQTGATKELNQPLNDDEAIAIADTIRVIKKAVL